MTNTTTGKTEPDAKTSSDKSTSRTGDVVGPVIVKGQTPETVELSHHLQIDGTAYAPGAKISVTPDYANQLRAQGYAKS